MTFSLFCLFVTGLASVEERFMYPDWNQRLAWVASLVFASAGIFYYFRKHKAFYFALGGSIVLAQFSVRPFHEVDQLFYKQLHIIEGHTQQMSMSDKMNLCDHVKSDYTSLKPKMMLHLEKVCSSAVMKLSQESSSELYKAFDWAYAEYVRKPHAIQAEALVCLYAETNQKEFALQLSEKHQFRDLTARLKDLGHCREFGRRSERQVASTKN